MRHRKPDISKLSRVTGFTPAISIDDMLQGVIGHLKDGNRKR